MPQPPFNPPFRAEHIGSFFRPPELLEAREACKAARLAREQLRVAEDAAIRDFVRLQEQLGFAAVTDGEFRRNTYTANFTTSGLTGISAEVVDEQDWAYTDAAGHRERARLPTVHGRIRRHGSQNAADVAFLRSITRATPKFTLAGPCYIHFRAGRARISRDVYPDLTDFWSDLISAYADELKALADAGCRYLQLDETSIAKLGDPKIRAALAARGDDWDRLLDTYIDVINAVVTSAPGELRIAMHLCRGNRMGHWQAAGGYDLVAERLFRRVSIDVFFLEYDSERAGSFEPLQLVPAHKRIVLGLVSTKAAELESDEALCARIRECSRYVDLERLAISPQCGFSSSDKANKIMSYERGVEKLKRVIEVARQMWSD
ncbi:MAG TPA: 5-methyltetrahydropteroyltriglutamate--homocysteine S-methyltransferase [Xanthobacteraceae bacterium]|nr:5-methyltetrahydropteroyltriglutamate--homocysteine S-methyltransferase [Xanthobacteraceae bacterium]